MCFFFFFLEEKVFTGQGHAETNLDKPNVIRRGKTPCVFVTGPPPDVNCNNGPCSRPFHRTCLLEWLQAVPTTRKSFNMLFGQCPFCDSSIAVRALGGTV
jgi:hypothetical protein